jgi:hypothetical protein
MESILRNVSLQFFGVISTDTALRREKEKKSAAARWYFKVYSPYSSSPSQR